jgi:hypothetical protein
MSFDRHQREKFPKLMNTRKINIDVVKSYKRISEDNLSYYVRTNATKEYIDIIL